ncbi:MAG: hypothetical protein KFH87_03825 [Bacteroidetes bacterium]|nr:hypothetical protein [Bacteroidota bacterium]
MSCFCAQSESQPAWSPVAMTGRRKPSARRRARTLPQWSSLLCLLLFVPTDVPAGIFPDSIYNWKKSSEALISPEGWDNAYGDLAELFRAYASVRLRTVTYTEDGRVARIDVVELPSRERAFGVFAAASGTADAHGIIGDAFAQERGAVHVNFGPFYFRVLSLERRPTIPPDRALVERTKRILFSRADCFGSDFPLPSEGRRLGSERYFAPDIRAWRTMQDLEIEEFLPMFGTRAAYAAEYELHAVGIRRGVYMFPFRQKEAAAVFTAELVQQLEQRMGSRDGDCVLPSFTHQRKRRVIAADASRVFLIVTDDGDDGCCSWARSLLRR